MACLLSLTCRCSIFIVVPFLSRTILLVSRRHAGPRACVLAVLLSFSCVFAYCVVLLFSCVHSCCLVLILSLSWCAFLLFGCHVLLFSRLLACFRACFLALLVAFSLAHLLSCLLSFLAYVLGRSSWSHPVKEQSTPWSCSRPPPSNPVAKPPTAY